MERRIDGKKTRTFLYDISDSNHSNDTAVQETTNVVHPRATATNNNQNILPGLKGDIHTKRCAPRCRRHIHHI